MFDVIRLVVFLASLLLAMDVHGGETIFESKPTRTHLIELYTSEGCSSCPPAEAWLSGLKDQPQLWRDFVPIAFHVDYWDHLGWKDPFASKKWTERQADYSVRWKGESVYTPAFALDGLAWRSSTLPPASTETVGVLKITVNGDRLVASFKPAGEGKGRYELHVARLGFGLGQDVTAGENQGRKLVHDFVVLGLTNETIKSTPKEMKFPVETVKPESGSRSAIAAWITQAGQLESIQAVGGWLQP
jgi:hypothetical protein